MFTWLPGHCALGGAGFCRNAQDHCSSSPHAAYADVAGASCSGSLPKKNDKMHFESAPLRDGFIGRLRCPPQTKLSLPTDLASAATQAVYVLYVLGGNVDMRHAGHRSVAKGGSIAMFDSAMAVGLEANGPCPQDILMLEVSQARLSSRRHAERPGGGLRLMQQAFVSPLAACMKLMAERMHTASVQELAALYEACVSLLVAAESRFEAVVMREPADSANNALLRDILDYINNNITESTLGPPDVAGKFGISVRYLHKLFVPSGMTFGSYVAARRLDHVRRELIAGTGMPPSIAALAQRWGFRDLSAFNRSFRKRFGCAPRHLRARFAN